MSLPNYQINVINKDTGRVLAMYDAASFDSLRYSRRLNDIGIVVLVVPYTSTLWSVFDWDNFVEIYRTHPVSGDMVLEDTYLVRSKFRFREENKEQLVVGGLSLNHLLARRIIDPTDDPAAVAGYSKKTGAADTVMRDYVREQAGDLASAGRFFPGFTVAAVLGNGSSTSKSFRYDNLFNACQEIAYETGIDFRIERTDLNLCSMVIGEFGTDYTRTTNEPQRLPWVGLSPSRGNLQQPALKIDRTDEKNYVYVLGQGQGDQRIVVQANTSDSGLTPFNRIEFTKDQRNVDKTDLAGLTAAAAAALNEQKVLHEFTFTPTGVDEGSIYRKDWDIGDFVTVIWEDEELDLRMAGIEIEVNEQGESLDVSVEQIYV